ncbi:hypothetical protein ASG56_03015 [Rhodococcus sp. Leaf7]|uniref:hypothetical protein n=1 Tax=unclassified Rhodococcus (in: high G+C Gram-positive bacteria) TaxID=192944 RepID=UPI0006F5BB89|nr:MULTISPECIES: hypothetical protein [unclassified Rhodococcus (in: high G+C Gram-positive bacteria)]KQU06633.1 hypothetical protein ASG56_03015 [Rhodococcus sp. Leaf7]KQU42153.1 hypothetical protein ASG64_03015 [Rhodococcus sp. Leaf247]
MTTDDTGSAHPASPIPDYDHLTVGDLTHRVRTLTVDQMQDLIAYERATAHRAHVLQILTTRLDDLQDGAQPSGGDPTSVPEVHDTPHASSVGPEHSPSDHTPLRHGVAYQTPARGKP